MLDTVSGRDAAILLTPYVQSGALDVEYFTLAVTALSMWGDTELPPSVMMKAWPDIAPRLRHYVDGGDTVPGLVADHVRAGLLAWAWMQPDRYNPCRWWACLHVCAGDQIHAAFYPAECGGSPVCGVPDGKLAGHYLLTQSPFVSARRWAGGTPSPN